MTGALMMLRALTSTHPGAGTGIGGIDLPIQREAHTDWPMVQGGSVKGVMRDWARRVVVADREAPESSLDEADASDMVKAIFGPPWLGASEHGGAISVTDSRLLAFPVRSLKGVYALITCPLALRRLAEDCAMALVSPPSMPAPDCAQDIDTCICATSDELFFAPKDGGGGEEMIAVLEDFRLRLTPNSCDAMSDLVDWLAPRTGALDLEPRLVVVDDTVFRFCAKYRTEVVTRNALDYNTKTVRKGHLFTQEFLPPETLMYSVLLLEKPYRPGSDITRQGMMAQLTTWFEDAVMQIGGDATTGKGLCRVGLVPGGEWNEDA